MMTCKMLAVISLCLMRGGGRRRVRSETGDFLHSLLAPRGLWQTFSSILARGSVWSLSSGCESTIVADFRLVACVGTLMHADDAMMLTMKTMIVMFMILVNFL